jgi:kinesin family member C1
MSETPNKKIEKKIKSVVIESYYNQNLLTPKKKNVNKENQNYIQSPNKFYDLELIKNEKKEIQGKLEQKDVELKILKSDMNQKVEEFEVLKKEMEKLKEMNQFLIDQNIDNEKIIKNYIKKVQDLKGNIRVFCRMRRNLENEESKNFYEYKNSNFCTNGIEISKEEKNSLSKEKITKSNFTFDKIFSEDSTQTEVFNEVYEVIQNSLDGFNCCIFAYGATGSGN